MGEGLKAFTEGKKDRKKLTRKGGEWAGSEMQNGGRERGSEKWTEGKRKQEAQK